MSLPLLSVKNLHLSFRLNGADLPALRGVNLDVQEGEIVSLVGESGSGKTLTGLSILNLISAPGKMEKGEILFRGENILGYSKNELESFRGSKAAMIFQEPMTALNPVFSIGYQINEVLKIHKGLTGKTATKLAASLLDKVGIPEPESRLKQYPFQLSGGMRQRAMIAMALASEPQLLIADEPTTALDVTIQAQILSLLTKLNKTEKMAILFITHDLGIVSQIAHKVNVMYCGRVVDSGPVENVFNELRHPYTEGLFNSLAVTALSRNEKRLRPIPGNAPSLSEIPSGCAFAPRCEYKTQACEREIPVKGNAGRYWVCTRP